MIIHVYQLLLCAIVSLNVSEKPKTRYSRIKKSTENPRCKLYVLASLATPPLTSLPGGGGKSLRAVVLRLNKMAVCVGTES